MSLLNKMKYLFLDIDGTLYDHEKKEIPESAQRAVRMAQEKGHHIFICTGRPCCLLAHVEKLPFEGVIASAGAYVKVGNRVIYEEGMQEESLDEIAGYCDSLHISYLLEGKQGVYLQPMLRAFFEKGEGQAASGHEFFKQKPIHGLEEYDPEKETIYKLCLYAKGEEAFHELEKRLPEKYHLALGKADATHPYSAELTLTKNHKASGIRRIMENCQGTASDRKAMTDIMADTIAVGDSLNDLEMLQECGIGIAMGNADERLKPYADYVTADIDKNGIYLAFEKFGLL